MKSFEAESTYLISMALTGRTLNKPECEDVQFSKEAIASIKQIKATDEILFRINEFEGLESLEIDSLYKPNKNYINKAFLLRPNLKHLKIRNNYYLKEVDLSPLKDLECLEIISNKSLTCVKGLENMDKLKNLTIYDNYRLENKKEVISLCRQVCKKGKVEADINYAPEMTEEIHSRNTALTFADSIGFIRLGQHFRMDKNKAAELIDACKNVLNLIIKEEDTEIQKFRLINKWIETNLEYDFQDYDKCIKNKNSEIDIINHTPLGAISNRTAVCEGYTKLAAFMCAMENMKVRSITCFSHDGQAIPAPAENRSLTQHGNHTILVIDENNNEYCCDITNRSIAYQLGSPSKFLETQQEISRRIELIEDAQIKNSESIKFRDSLSLTLFAANRFDEAFNKENGPYGQFKTLDELLNIPKDEKMKAEFALREEETLSRLKSMKVNVFDFAEKQIINLIDNFAYSSYENEQSERRRMAFASCCEEIITAKEVYYLQTDRNLLSDIYKKWINERKPEWKYGRILEDTVELLSRYEEKVQGHYLSLSREER